MERSITLSVIIGIFGVLFVALVLGFITYSFSAKVKSVNFSPFDNNSINYKNYSYTKAYCSEDNKCVDLLIKCYNGTLVSMSPISPVVNNGEEWTDPRENSEFEYDQLCSDV